MGQTIDKMKSGLSRVRNEALANAFAYMNLIEQWGSGVPRIIEKVKEAGLQAPEFLGGDIDLRINIYRKTAVGEKRKETSQETFSTSQEINKTDQESYNSSQETSQENLDASQETDRDEDNNTDGLRNYRIIVNEIRRNPSVTQKELQVITGLSRSGVRYILSRLQEEGSLIRVGATKNGKWIIQDNP